jgi:hypothetical protein
MFSPQEMKTVLLKWATLMPKLKKKLYFLDVVPISALGGGGVVYRLKRSVHK